MSLRLRLLAIIGVCLMLLWSAVAAWMLLDLRHEMRAAMDDRLAASARMVAGLIGQVSAADSSGPDRRSEALDVVARDGLACEVSLMRGEATLQTVARTAGSPKLASAAPGFGIREFGGKPWRTYVLQQGGLRVVTADRMDIRDKLLRDVALSAGIPFVVALMGSLPLVWFGIGRGLRPIERVRTALSKRRPDDEAPLPDVDAPPELRPLVGTIQHLLERVRDAIARERRFTDDAAHELRTPLTAIKTHLQVARLALRKPGADEVVAEALENADAGVLRFQRTLDQLLLLARLDGRFDAAPNETTDAESAARQAINDACVTRGPAPALVLEASDFPIVLRVPETLLVLALRNLLDNAMRHSPEGRRVSLHLRSVGGEQVIFSVLDDGPGLSEADCALATRRFWRRAGATSGSGLGLSIVSAISERFDGELRLRKRDAGGFEATLTFPAIAAGATL